MLKKVMLGLLALCLVGGIVYAIYDYKANKLYRNENFAVGNGRLEATEVSLSAKLKERIEVMNVNEGDLIKKEQLLVKMQTTVLEAQLAEAKGKLSQAEAEEKYAEAMIDVKKAAVEAAKAALEQAKHIRDEAKTEYDRDSDLLKKGSGTQERVDQKRTAFLKNESQVKICEADILQAQADLKSAIADDENMKAKIVAARASVATIEADIKDSYLYSPVNGRVQYRIAQYGEVVQDGGRILNLVDMEDVYLNFYLPVQAAMRLKIGDEARIVFDIAKDFPIPATITYVDPIAQFTPKTVETQTEREKLVFRVKAHVDMRLVSKIKEYVKTGIPGVCWVRLDSSVDWPKELSLAPETKELLQAKDDGTLKPAPLMREEAKEKAKEKAKGNKK